MAASVSGVRRVGPGSPAMSGRYGLRGREALHLGTPPDIKADRIAKCMAKVRRDRQGAERTAEAMRTSHPGSMAYAYQCRWCGYWHVSTNMGSEAERRRKERRAANGKSTYAKRREYFRRRLGGEA